MNQDLTQGRITSSLLRFAWPFMVGNLLQQLYNVVDTLIVGRYLGSNALGAVGSSYTLMTFLTSILLGLCMGSGKSWPSASRTFGLKGASTVSSAFCSCSTATIAPSSAPACRWCSRQFPWAPGWRWPMASRPSPPSVSRGSGCRCPSAGFWPMWWAFCATAVFAAGTVQRHLPENNDHLPILPRQIAAAMVW